MNQLIRYKCYRICEQQLYHLCFNVCFFLILVLSHVSFFMGFTLDPHDNLFLQFFAIFFVINFPRLNYNWWQWSGVWVLNKDNSWFLYFKHNEYIINYYKMVFSHFIVQFHLACYAFLSWFVSFQILVHVFVGDEY